jgi:hypothetical protein
MAGKNFLIRKNLARGSDHETKKYIMKIMKIGISSVVSHYGPHNKSYSGPHLKKFSNKFRFEMKRFVRFSNSI